MFRPASSLCAARRPCQQGEQRQHARGVATERCATQRRWVRRGAGMGRVVHGLVALCALGTGTTWTTPSGARDTSKERCLAAYDSAQVLLRDGSLIDAREKLVFCGGAECPQVMHADCQRWLLEVEASIPTVVFQVEYASGAATGPATVSINGGEPVPLDGRAMSVNPGQHEVTFSAEGFQTTSKVLVFSEGEKLRREVVVLEQMPDASAASELAPAEVPGDDASSSGFPFTLPIILASSAAVVGGAGLVYFGLEARDGDERLDDCSPNCTQDRVDGVKQDYLMANLSLGLGVIGLVTATALVVLQYPDDATAVTVPFGLQLQPLAHGVSVAGHF